MSNDCFELFCSWLLFYGENVTTRYLISKGNLAHFKVPGKTRKSFLEVCSESVQDDQGGSYWSNNAELMRRGKMFCSWFTFFLELVKKSLSSINNSGNLIIHNL